MAAYRLSQFETIHIRHGQISNDEIWLRLLEQPERLEAIRSTQNFISMTLQRSAKHSNDLALIINKQNAHCYRDSCVMICRSTWGAALINF